MTDENISLGEGINLTVDGNPLHAHRGQTIAVALIASGRRIFRRTRLNGKARELLKYLDYPGSPRAIPVPDTPVRLSETPAEIRHRAPTLGEHTDEVLQELGFSAEEISGYRQARVI